MDIHPKEQNIDKVFSGTNYHIDFYQREYKWGKTQIDTLLDDIFYKFNQEYQINLDVTSDNIETQYSWYYLNTYVTNEAEGKTFVVDGQQRLTSISLILLALYHLAEDNGLQKERIDWLETKLYGASADGQGFWIGHGKRKDIMKYLFDNREVGSNYKINNITVENIIKNYKTIFSYLSNNLNTKHKLDTFILYFLLRVVIIKLDVNRTDVPMVFEVINDRGISLNPYEILKGKLLGQIDKSEVDKYSAIWEESVGAIERESDKKDIVDIFFRNYFKAKLTRTRAEGQKLDGPYQRVIFDKDFNEKLKLKNNPSNVKLFIANEFRYFADLYREIESYKFELNNDYIHVYCNYLNEMETQSMLIISVCKLNDPEKEQKIKIISKLVDKMFVLLQLNQSYDSNRFMEIIYELMGALDGKNVDEYSNIFDSIIVKEINRNRSSNEKSPFIYKFFKTVGYSDFNKRFLRYFFARVEYYIATNIHQEMIDNMWNFTRGTGKGTGYHIEHILGRNDENLKIFGNDEDKFESERNRLGALLLLKGVDNQSSGKEPYKDKLRTYAGTARWNQSLTEDFYHANLSITNFIKEQKLDMCPIEHFDEEAIESRTKLLFNIVKLIWE